MQDAGRNRRGSPGGRVCFNLESGIRNLESAFLLLFLLASGALAGPAEDHIDAQLRVVRWLDSIVPEMSGVADDGAKRLLAGGQLYLAGERGMVLELLTRAGGLCCARAFQPGKTQLGRNDIVLYSSYGVQEKPFSETLGRVEALVVGFPAAVNAAAAVKLPENERCIPAGLLPEKMAARAATPAVAIAQWAFTAELIGAGRRQGKQLAVYLSIHLDEGRKRFERTKGLLFEPDLKPEPAASGQFARAFLGQVRAALEATRNDEIGRIRQAAAWLREAKAAGRKVVRHLYGHLPPTEAGLPGDPALFTHTVTGPVGEKGVEWIRTNLQEGDVYLLVGYQQNEDAMAAAANALGARTVFITSLGPGGGQAKSPRHLYINPHWPLTDGCLDLSGYDVKACPLSGILGLTCYYAVCAEAASRE